MVGMYMFHLTHLSKIEYYVTIAFKVLYNPQNSWSIYVLYDATQWDWVLRDHCIQTFIWQFEWWECLCFIWCRWVSLSIVWPLYSKFFFYNLVGISMFYLMLLSDIVYCATFAFVRWECLRFIWCYSVSLMLIICVCASCFVSCYFVLFFTQNNASSRLQILWDSSWSSGQVFDVSMSHFT